MRRDGRLFLRGATYWIALYIDGQQVRESTKTTDRKEAEKYWRKRRKEKEDHEEDSSKKFSRPHDKKRTIAELMDGLKRDFEIRGKDSRQNLSNIARVRSDFGSMRAASLTAEDVDRYVQERLTEERDDQGRIIKGDAKASINRVTQLLRQAYKFAGVPAPRIRKLPEKGNERQGFFSEHEIRRVIANLPADLSDFTLFGWLTGMRKGEIASLAWQDVDGDVLRLRAENAKTGEARMIPLEGELAELIARRQAARQVESEGTVMISSLIFHRAGTPIGDFRKAWARAGKKAGIQRHFHDLRRSSCRNMLAAGVPQSIAMKVSGHKTDIMFRRYAISSESDIRTALRRTQEYLKTVQENVVAMPAPQNGGQIAHSATGADARRSRK
jgi:integrase